MTRVIDTNRQDWHPVRPDLTSGVSGIPLLEGTTKMVLTKVAPGGAFQLHRDPYGHLFHVISGHGRFTVEGEVHNLTAGKAVRIRAGELHGYENPGGENLLLFSVNVSE